MPERIYKLQPNRTLALRGFDYLGAGAALHSATANSFKVSGVFRDAADFAVLILHDADNFYEHPRLRYLPDFDFDGLTLQFDVRYTGLMPLDSSRFPTISWPYLSIIHENGSKSSLDLRPRKTLVSGSYTPAAASFRVLANAVQQYDRLTLVFLNYAFDVLASGGETATQIVQMLAGQINGTTWIDPDMGIQATADGDVLRVQAKKAGRDGNSFAMYALAKAPERLATEQTVAMFSGGSSDATWRVSIDFSSDIPNPKIRQMWLTFAPALAHGVAQPDTEWEAVFTNWAVTGPEEKRQLRVAAPGSVRIEEDSSLCRYTGEWLTETGFFSGGYAKRAASASASVAVQYSCPTGHDLYVGTSLYADRGMVAVEIDGVATPPLNCTLDAEVKAAVNTRRLLRRNMTAGSHTVTLRLSGAGFFYFDFLEAVVPGDVPGPLPARTDISPALDYSTDHTYKLPPARIHWIFDQLGLAGPMNEYIGVFWWNQRKRVGGHFPQIQVQFSGQFQGGDGIFLYIGQRTGNVATEPLVSKSVFPADTPETIARHFALAINASFVGVWASTEGSTLTITTRSPTAAYTYPFDYQLEKAVGSSGEITKSGSLENGQPGTWEVDMDQAVPLNRGAQAWHADFFAECAQRNREITLASSMELVYPPESYAARYYDGSPVVTDVGFGSMRSTHCTFSSQMRAHHVRLFRYIADLMQAAGLTPDLQCGEFLWWFFCQNNLKLQGASNTAPILINTGTAPHKLATGDRVWIEGVKGNATANGQWTVTVTSPTAFTLDGSTGNGTYVAGGTLHGGSMAFYDDETKAAAEAALARPLARFHHQVDDPQQNGGADAIFLRNRLRDYAAQLIADVKSTHPNARFEILFPYDVNHPEPAGVHLVGGRMNRFVNLPVEWERKETCSFDRFKTEALDFGAWSRDLNLAEKAIELPLRLGWPVDSVRYLVPVFGCGYPWEQEYWMATGLKIAVVNLWAFDHVCLYNWAVEERILLRKSSLTTSAARR